MPHSHKDFSINGSKFAHAAKTANFCPICISPNGVKPEESAKTAHGRKIGKAHTTSCMPQVRC